jgi:hypothetical protein
MKQLEFSNFEFRRGGAVAESAGVIFYSRDPTAFPCHQRSQQNLNLADLHLGRSSDIFRILNFNTECRQHDKLPVEVLINTIYSQQRVLE